MCVHREHRTGNCRVCEESRRAASEVGRMAAARIYEQRPVMPQVWDGDDS